jgi:spermidine/putrescine transport system ATP-binding protein
MAATVERAGGENGRCHVRLGEFVLAARTRAAPQRGSVRLAIRPERVHLRPREATGANHMPGMVERVVFLGPTRQTHVRLADGQALQALERNDGGRAPHTQGEPVSVELPADALRVLPEGPPSGDGDAAQA